MNYNLNSGYGRLLATKIASCIGPSFGKIFVVCGAATDTNYDKLSQLLVPDPDGEVKLFTSLETAYAAAVTNRNDVILLDAQSSHSIATGIAWTKNRVHVIGMDGGDRLVQQGAKVELTGAVDCAYVLKVTGVRNSFRNIKFIQSSTHANALNVLQMGGEGNLYKNCSAVFGVANNLGSTSACEVINGEDSGTFIDNQWGSDTLLTSAARAVMTLKIVTAGQECKSNVSRGDRFLISSSSAASCFIKVNSATDVLFTNVWDRPIFSASVDSAGGIAVTSAIISITGLVKGTLNFAYPAGFNITDYAAAGSNANAGVQVLAPVSSANANIGIKPTA